MATTQLLAQNDNTAEKFLKNDVGHSMIPLSHSVQYPVDVDGAILPCCLIETVPSDRFEISNEILLRQLQPLKVPQMTRYTLNTAYFYCSNRLAWKKWPMFMDQANKGRADINYSFELPRVFNFDITVDGVTKRTLADNATYTGTTTINVNYKNSLHTYFNISLNRNFNHASSAAVVSDFANITDDTDELPLAFPEFGYQMIVRDFYTNIDRLSDINANSFYNFNDPLSDWTFKNLFPVDDDEIKLVDGPQIKSGYHTGDDSDINANTGFILDKVRYHDVRDDYFVSSKRSPMRGEAPTVDTTVAVAGIDASDIVSDVLENTAHGGRFIGIDNVNNKLFSSENTANGTDSFNTSAFANNVQTPRNSPDDYTESERNQIINALNKLKVNLQTTKAINAAELRLLSQLTVWQELNMLHKPTYNDFLNAHYNGIKVGDSLVEAPQYIGGTSQVIQINEVLQTSESTDSSKLGTQAAVAHSLSSSGVGSFYCPDYGFIIGIMYILPDMIYKPAMPRWASRRTVEDYFFPEFANLSMQATLNKELFFSNDSEWNNRVLGYVGAYDEMRTIPNYCAGEMLDDNKIDLQRWALLRKFSNSNKPAINQNFLTAKGNVDKSAWSAPNEPKFMFQIANYIKAVRPMPYIAIPKAL